LLAIEPGPNEQVYARLEVSSISRLRDTVTSVASRGITYSPSPAYMSSSAPKVWFITGASSGFGREVTEYVLSKGGIVIATLRKPSVLDSLKAQYPSSQLIILKLDVTNLSDITAAFAQAKAQVGRIDIVFNNAGSGLLAEVEGTTEEALRNIFEVNFFGAARVSREAVRFFRDENKPGAGGKLLVNKSFAGIQQVPGVGYYSASKHALEAVTQALAGELDPEWNIKVTSIEAGAFATDGASNMVIIPPHPAYTKPTLPSTIFRNLLKDFSTVPLGDPKKAAVTFYKLSELENPPLRFPIGKDSIGYIRTQLASIKKDVDEYESWSEGLQKD